MTDETKKKIVKINRIQVHIYNIPACQSGAAISRYFHTNLFTQSHSGFKYAEAQIAPFQLIKTGLILEVAWLERRYC